MPQVSRNLRRLFALSVAAGTALSCCLAVLTLLQGGAGRGGGYRLQAPGAPVEAEAPTAGTGWRPLYSRDEALRPQPVRQLVPYITDTCSGRAPCISFGTPLFYRWRLWLQQADPWLQGGDQDACGRSCELVSDPSAADAVLFHGRDLGPRSELRRHPGQRWVYLNMESPIATKRYGYDVSSDPKYRFLFNWTATTSLRSSIHLSYGSWEPQPHQPQDLSPLYSVSLKKHLAFAVFSNCGNSFNNRTAKVAELQRFMPVHVYGDCGDRKLPRNSSLFQQVSQQYRFYLSFENALCRDYITEKFHANGLGSNAVPVVFGGTSRADYESVSPPHSFVFALDFASMRQLAGFLIRLAADETRYAEYFTWKRHFRASAKVSILCRVCTKLHTDRWTMSMADLSEFYDIRGNCKASDYQYLL